MSERIVEAIKLLIAIYTNILPELSQLIAEYAQQLKKFHVIHRTCEWNAMEETNIIKYRCLVSISAIDLRHAFQRIEQSKLLVDFIHLLVPPTEQLVPIQFQLGGPTPGHLNLSGLDPVDGVIHDLIVIDHSE